MSVNEKMSSTLTRKIRYYVERSRNAFWMLRTGRFKLFFNSLYIEFYPQVEMVRTQLHLEERQVSDSAYIDKRKVLRPGFRPTTSQSSPEIPLQADTGVVADELKQILSTLTVQENIVS
jgi:hypothetical protein